MTRKMDFFGRRLQFQRTIPGFLENLGCLTLSNSKISEGVSFVFKKIAIVERAEEKFVFQRHFIFQRHFKNVLNFHKD